ncbi:ELM1/GtrOC1 family putative glycosyltransferase [Pseudahrensia aquimaris]|uniref:ELM1/GtrOC1 family putative glycosyltransferase n=1 Tax=Pseudahrensia aquimaris TaxID=744461 RepID=A0ABW3FE78_9HYPH
MKLLLISDGRPGHVHQSDGILAAIRKMSQPEVYRAHLEKRSWPPRRIRTAILASKNMRQILPTATSLKLAGLDVGSIPFKPDIIISTGGACLGASVMAAQVFNAVNIHSGSTRGFSDSDFSVVLHLNPSFSDRSNYIIGLKPSAIQPIPRAADQKSGLALLIGAPTSSHPFSKAEWSALVSWLEKTEFQLEILSSPRTPLAWTNDLLRVSSSNSARIMFRNFQSEGVGGVAEALASSMGVMVTADSNSMIAEAVAAQVPVVSLEPSSYGKVPDVEYNQLLRSNGWVETLKIEIISDEQIAKKIATCTPMTENHLDTLVKNLREKLPQLFGSL